jgi:hypothetical protein
LLALETKQSYQQAGVAAASRLPWMIKNCQGSGSRSLSHQLPSTNGDAIESLREKEKARVNSSSGQMIDPAVVGVS